MSPRRLRTYGELQRELEADPEWVAERERNLRAREKALREHQERFFRDERPVLDALAAAGLRIEHLQELVSGPDIEDPEHVRVLMEWLPRVEYEPAKDTIARALTVRAARPVAAPVLLQEISRTDEDLARWAIANALAYTADRSYFDAIAELLKDESLGNARSVLVGYFGRWRGEQSIAVLRPLLADDDLGRYALKPLAKLRATQARPEMERFLEHEQDWVRNEAKRALAKLGRGTR